MKIGSRFSLRMKLILMVMGIMGVVGAGSFFGIKAFRGSYEKEILSSYEMTAKKLGLDLSAQFFERYGDVQAFAVNESVKTLKEAQIKIDLDKYVALYGIYDVILVLDMNGRYIGSNTKDASGKEVNLEMLRGFNYSQSPWFRAAVSGQFTEDKEKGFVGTYFEEFHVDPIFRMAFGEVRVGTGFTALIKNDAGKPVGVITNRANTKWVDVELVNTQALLSDGGDSHAHVAIVDNKGLALANYSPDIDGKKEVIYDLEKNIP